MTQTVQSFEGLADALKAQGFKLTPIKAKSSKSAKPTRMNKAEMLAAKDKRILAGFKRQGITNVVLMDRTDRSKEFNVRPYGRPANGDQPATGWLGQRRQVMAGSRSVQGLFHFSQTEEIVATEA